jgi:hypothetical protein
MAKKCAPGVICIESITLFVLLFVFIASIYFFHMNRRVHEKENTMVINVPAREKIQHNLVPVASRIDVFNDPYVPPLKTTGLINMGGRVGLPVNIQTRGILSDYQQVGILTRSNRASSDMILPLMGRRIMSGRDKWQYYTISGSGNLNTKLPVSVKGKSCTSEYGCDDIQNGDVVYVEGYNETFRVTIYDNSAFQYIPQL